MSQYKVTFFDYSNFGLPRNDVPDVAIIEVGMNSQITNELFHFKKLSKEELVKQVGIFTKLSNSEILSTANSLWNLAACYDLGHECERNAIEAKRYYRMALIQEQIDNNNINISNLPSFQELRNGVYQFILPNTPIAYTQAESFGYPLATYFVGLCHLCGHGVVENDNMANHYFAKAMQLGCPEAYGSLGVSYLQGYGVNPDRVMAFTLFKLAYQLGDQDGGFNYGILLRENGDFSGATEVMKKLSRNGHGMATDILKKWGVWF